MRQTVLSFSVFCCCWICCCWLVCETLVGTNSDPTDGPSDATDGPETFLLLSICKRGAAGQPRCPQRSGNLHKGRPDRPTLCLPACCYEMCELQHKSSREACINPRELLSCLKSGLMREPSTWRVTLHKTDINKEVENKSLKCTRHALVYAMWCLPASKEVVSWNAGYNCLRLYNNKRCR